MLHCQEPQIFRKMMMVKPKGRPVKGRSEMNRFTWWRRCALNLWPEDLLSGGWGGEERRYTVLIRNPKP